MKRALVEVQDTASSIQREAVYLRDVHGSSKDSPTAHNSKAFSTGFHLPTRRSRHIWMALFLLIASAAVVVWRNPPSPTSISKTTVFKVTSQPPPPPRPVVVQPEDRPYQKILVGCGECSPTILFENRLVFFTIPKVGCTSWKFLFRRMMGYDNWNTYGPDGLPHNPQTNGLVYLHDLKLSKANEIMTSPDWTRAVFVRDPKSRLLSAYLDKVQGPGTALRNCCRRLVVASLLPQPPILQNETAIHAALETCYENSTPFDKFVANLVPKCPNDHWRPQHLQMPQRYWNYINFVGHLENLQADARRLMERVGAWEEYGTSGWGPYENASLFSHDRTPKHSTGAVDRLKDHYTPVLERTVEAMYAQDYDNPVLNLTRIRLFPSPES